LTGKKTKKKKTEEKVQDLLAERMRNVKGSEIVLVGGWIGLTWAIKTGAVDPLSWFFGKQIAWDWVGKTIGLDKIDSVKDLKERHIEELQKKKQELASNPLTPKGEAYNKMIADIDKTIARISAELAESEGKRANPEKAVSYAELEFGKWMVSMGIAALAIYFAQEHTASEIVEMVPFVQ
jgi:hypothetical protein